MIYPKESDVHNNFMQESYCAQILLIH